MSLAGKLEDVPLADVMQFIHLGRRTGTLSLERGGATAQVSFHHGAIIGAWYDRSKLLGELLLSKGLMAQEELEEALMRQSQASTHESLGRILIAAGTVDSDKVRDAIKAQIEQTIYDLVTWAYGSFTFELDNMEHPVDDVAVFPSELFPDIDFNTQMVLLEAARIFDERHRDEEAAKAAAAIAPPPPADAVRALPDVGRARQASDLFDDAQDVGSEAAAAESLAILTEYEVSDQEPLAARLQLVSLDTENLGDDLVARLATFGTELELVALEHAGRGDASDEVIVALDLRAGGLGPTEVADLNRRHPELPIICILEDVGLASAAYSAGAAAVVPREPSAVAGCFQNMARFRTVANAAAAKPSADQKSAFAKLRRVVADLRSGVFSASVALSLMNVIAESVDRAVLFLVKRDSLTALGAFGYTPDRQPLATQTKGLVIPIDDDSALTRAIGARYPLDLTAEEANLPEALSRLIGPPRSGQVVVFPVLGSDKVILVVYTDNGQLYDRIEEIDVLDLAASEVGIAFENELLRRQLAERR